MNNNSKYKNMYSDYDLDFSIKSNTARGGGKSKNQTKKDAKHNKNQSCYSSKCVRKYNKNLSNFQSKKDSKSNNKKNE